MKFEIYKQDFLEGLDIVSSAIPQKTPIQVLTGVKMDITNDGILLLGSSQDILIQYNLKRDSYKCYEEGKVVVPFSILYAIIQKLKEGKITFELKENQVLINSGKSKFKLTILNYSDYPIQHINQQEDCITFNSKLIKTIVKETTFACSTSEKRPILTGVNLNVTDNVLECVATDSYRLSKKTINLENSYKDFNVTIPSKVLSNLDKLMKNYDGDLNLYLNKSTLLFTFNGILFQSRLLEGVFPETKKIFSFSTPHSLTFNREELLDTLNRVSVLSVSESGKDKELSYNVIKLKLSLNDNETLVELSTNSNQLGEAKENIEVVDNTKGEVIELLLGFNGRYLADSLNSFTSNEITMNFAGNLTPFTITSKGYNLTQVISPMKLGE